MAYVRLLTSSETAKRLHKSVRTLQRWRDRVPTYGPPPIRVGWRVMYAESDVNGWLLAQRERGK